MRIELLRVVSLISLTFHILWKFEVVTSILVIKSVMGGVSGLSIALDSSVTILHYLSILLTENGSPDVHSILGLVALWKHILRVALADINSSSLVGKVQTILQSCLLWSHDLSATDAACYSSRHALVLVSCLIVIKKCHLATKHTHRSINNAQVFDRV